MKNNMRRISALFLIVVLCLCCFISCSTNVSEFKGSDGNTYYYEFSDGIKSITNYHPYKLWALPKYQELVQLGEGAGLENEGNVYFIYVVDTSVNSENDNAYYTCELDGETKELLCESGEYFADEAEKNAVVERLLDLIGAVNFE